MLYVNRFETCRVFITDTDDNTTESIGLIPYSLI